MKVLAAAAAAVVLSLNGCAGAPARRRAADVTAEGWAAVGAGGAAEAERRALADAQRRAVEQGAGVELASLAVVDDGAVSLERHSAAARGVMERYRVLSRTRQDGAVVVRIRARVRRDPAIAGDARGWPPGTGPRLLLEDDAAAEADDGDRRAVLRQWTRAGGGLAANPGEADLVLRVRIEASAQFEPRLRPFVSWRARVWLTRADAAPGGASVAREAAAIGLDAAQARSRAVETAAADAVATLAALPPTAWRRR